MEANLKAILNGDTSLNTALAAIETLPETIRTYLPRIACAVLLQHVAREVLKHPCEKFKKLA